jgi:hypothetical protein
MAEIIDLNINIGANTTDFESSLIKAQNLLKQFEAALKKATNVGEINYLNNQIKNLNTTISSLNQKMNTIGRPAGDATNALSNLSRVAQDAPYGFIGIANNLNPLLESFQRLQKESGSSAEAFKAMAAGLVGPAGIGLALGVVSSLAVTFGKDIAAFFKGPTEKLKEFREELAKISQDLYKVVGEAQANRTIGLNLVSVIAGGTAGQQEEALKKLKILYKDSKDIQALKIGADNAYMTHLVNMASKQEEYNSKEKNNAQALSLIYENQKKIIAERDKALKAVKGDIITGGGAGGGASVVTAEQQIANINKRYNPILKELEKQIVSAKSKNLELVTALSVFETPDSKSKKEGSSPIVNYAREENKALTLELAKMKALRDKMKSIGLEPLQLFNLPSEERAKEDKRKGYFEKRAKELLEQSNKGGFGSFMQQQNKKDLSKIEGEDAEKKRIDDLTKSYNDFAYTLSNNVTNALMGMYDAMQSGQSPLQAIGDMFANIGRQIAAAVIQALIFQALLEAFPALKGAFAAMGAASSGKGLGGLLGLASGGIATGPTLAMIGEGSESEAVLPLSKLGNIMQGSFNAGSMSGNSMGQNGQFVLRGQDLVLAMQRSNSSLNIIRG